MLVLFMRKNGPLKTRLIDRFPVKFVFCAWIRGSRRGCQENNPGTAQAASGTDQVRTGTVGTLLTYQGSGSKGSFDADSCPLFDFDADQDPDPSMLKISLSHDKISYSVMC